MEGRRRLGTHTDEARTVFLARSTPFWIGAALHGEQVFRRACVQTQPVVEAVVVLVTAWTDLSVGVAGPPVEICILEYPVDIVAVCGVSNTDQS